MIELGNMAPLMGAWEKDPWGRLRPPLSVEAAEMSALLAQATYHMDVEAWIKAGWRDVTIQVDGDLTNGVEPGAQSAMSRLSRAWKMFRVRSKIRGANPVGQVMDAWRQRDGSSTGKALVMIHPADLGRYVVAISFMGTGERIQDWVSNLRVAVQGGIHQGFLELARQFEGNEEDIDFPETAQELGLERLTLRHILQDMRNPNSRFTLWLSGHSQGAALVQVYAHHKIVEDGVLPRNMIGYGMAAPSVMSSLAVNDPSAYPIYLVQNGDDLVPRMGSQVHLGVCLLYPTGEAMRRACYTWRTDADAVRHRQQVAAAIRHMQDTPSIMEVLTAFLKVLADYTTEDMLEALGTLGLHLPLKNLLAAADAGVEQLAAFAARHLASGYVSVTGKTMSMARVAAYQVELAQTVNALGLKNFCLALAELMTQPHRITQRHQAEAPYLYIVRHGMEELIPAVWRSGTPPQLQRAGRQMAAAVPADGSLVRRRPIQERRVHRHPRYQDPRRRTNTRHQTPTLQPGTILPGEKHIRHP